MALNELWFDGQTKGKNYRISKLLNMPADNIKNLYEFATANYSFSIQFPSLLIMSINSSKA